MQFQQAHRHHGEIGHHVVLFQKGANGAQHFGGFSVAAVHDFVKGLFAMRGPVPGVLERLDLRLRLLAGRRLEQHVIGRVGIERRVEIDQIDALAANLLAQNFEIVTVIEPVGHEILFDAATGR